MSIGLVLPVRTGSDDIDFRKQLELAALADELGFSALWVRDVPLNGPWYPEPIGHLDPWVMLGALAARTRTIALGTAATVLPLRHPVHIAKSAVSLQALSGDRLLLGLGSGDRPEEYRAFNRDFESRRELFKAGWEELAAAFAAPSSITAGDTRFELRPVPTVAPPMLAIGSAGQSLDWIARKARGWATYYREPAVQRDRHALWRQAVTRGAGGGFRAFAVAMGITLNADAGEPPERLKLGYRTGVNGLAGILDEQRALGVHHLMLNLETSGLPVRDALTQVAQASGLTASSG
ncbi:coenzyme F420-dependent N5,N10-methylene tetrahydromethanopterin reductase [Agaricicola taiwanensis]|uniref:Coenzyme F420-dependent N5,N10-methylene tetrahydromethanopterin reductase n=2 Tax=Agaricicola taiwanensis TaxID=591372 RepID=A0A8J2YL85_9RHOB|nr:coenzyme F420-dependent N5,N10-methylene tetrahydromethanopterin reductase [Agaricicola taiwanensis]